MIIDINNNSNNIPYPLSTNNKKINEPPLNNRYEKPYYHLNYDEDLNKRDILRQLEALDKKSENLMNNRLFPKALTDKDSQHSNKAIKSRYNGFGETNNDFENKSRASMNISSMKSDLRAPEMNKSHSNISNNAQNNMAKSNSQYSQNKSFRESQNEISIKSKSIENTYFMNK